jgi:outer membrane protein OmpA-like peptidoglycan-associated protein
MQSDTNFIRKSPIRWSVYRPSFCRTLTGIALLAGFLTSISAQESGFKNPTWWFGAAGGANVNFYSGSTQLLNTGFTAPVPFHNGTGAGLYLAPLIEYYERGSTLGVTLQVGYDSRKSTFNTVSIPGNTPADLSANLNYITVEPSLRWSMFRPGFYLFGGPRLAFNLDKAFTYQPKSDPNLPEQPASPSAKGDFSNVHKVLVSMQLGAGYDIPLTAQDKRTQVVLAPFISFHPSFGQSPRSVETWNLTSLRVGAALKFGCGRAVSVIPDTIAAVVPEVRFFVTSPQNIPVQRRVRETFPLRNYVFFDRGSTEIPNRYVMVSREMVKDFKEDQLEVFTPKNLSGRSDRGMIVYYNVLNILGDRMGKNPFSTITLVGSSEKGPADGKAMAESIKRYLAVVFGISPTRVVVEGRDKPKIASEKPGSTRELDLLREGDRRVSIESTSPALLMEFQTGPDAPLKPVEINEVQDAPPDSYVTFTAMGSEALFTSWSLEIMDADGKLQFAGPFTQDQVSIPGKSILGTRSDGDFKVKMIGHTKSGKQVTRESSVHMVLWTAPENEQGMRYSVIFEFDEAKVIPIYVKYLTDIVTPKIPKGARVIVHGYTDIIGEAAYNQKLSMARAVDVKNILAAGLAKTGRNDVKFEVYGFGEDEGLAPFDNKYPEERFYNRTVLIDIIPEH